jgi:multiple sugar transport system ATP-binding protein
MADIVLDDVWKVYADGTEAVRTLSIDIADGEFMVLVGPSGCGKTTALRMVAGLESISKGELRIGGRVVNDVPPKERDIAMVFQNYALYPHMSVYDNMAFGLKLRKLSKTEIDRRVREAADILGLEEFLQRKPKALSGGQRQRVAMGRAIVREPKAFLMDEPLSNLDAKLRVQMRTEIARIQHDLSVTTIYVTHDQVEAMTMGDRVAVMSMGVLQQVDRPQALYDAPKSVFVASFIGTPPMNLFSGTILTDNGTVSVTLGSATMAVSQSCVARYGGIRQLSGRNVVVGVRAEDVYPASTRPDLPTLAARVELVEALGSGVMAHFNVDVESYHSVLARGAGAVDEGDETLGSRPNLVASFPPRVDLRLADTVPVAIDPGALHFFDEETGAALT